MIDVSKISADLEAVANPYPNRDYEVGISIPEFTSVCPRTGQPDFATIEVHYIPDKYIIELICFQERYWSITCLQRRITSPYM